MDAKWQCRQQGRDAPWEVREAMEANAEQWLVNRSEAWGFTLDTTPQLSGYRQHQWQRKQRQIRFSSVDYEGVITVADPERLRAALFNGVGRSRAFGCGMLMVRRG
ncbi:type I-E CRISPR-associated protein Cas6/Cse3/CasE [Tamilnaduibacter salinus]